MDVRVKFNPKRLKQEITELYETRSGTDFRRWTEKQLDVVDEAVSFMNRGHLRIAQKVDGVWVTNEWAKKAVLLYFQCHSSQPFEIGPLSFVDKIPVKSWAKVENIRVVPPAVVRYGAYVAQNCVIMPSFINIGAYVDEGSMIDTWATVGSCAQIGRGVHISGGVGIGGVLEPLQATPVVIEDHVFVGSRAIIVEGVIVEEGAVIGAGVVLTSSTKIIDMTKSSPVTYRGRVPSRAVVIPGVVNKKFKGGTAGVPCALIIGERKASTDQKTSLNHALRDFEISV